MEAAVPVRSAGTAPARLRSDGTVDLSNNPSSLFVTGLMAARADRECRYALRDGELAVHYTTGRTERRRLATAEVALRRAQGTFRVTLPDGPELRAALDRVVARCQSARA